MGEDVLSRVRLWQGDLTTLQVDAIVNAANSTLLGGGGVDGAIHRKAGPELLAYCRGLNGCRTGEAKVSPGFGLAARHVIHTVGPIWSGGGRGEPELLARCYLSSLRCARDLGVETVAFPCISTGVYGYPQRAAADVATDAVVGFLGGNSRPRAVILCAFSEAAFGVLEQSLSRFRQH